MEDYIAKFSEQDTLQIVSIYQRRICDEEGNIDGGIIEDIHREKKSFKIVKNAKLNVDKFNESLKSSYMSTQENYWDNQPLFDRKTYYKIDSRQSQFDKTSYALNYDNVSSNDSSQRNSQI